MDPRTQERVERWDSRPFSNGYDGLSTLAAEDFSGAVTAGQTWLFMLNGRIVGIVDGTIDAFENATGTAYVAPDPSLPLLCSMQLVGGETRAKYYTNDTPLEDVDETLSANSFTGYVELSEGVLSGDYYLVYYGGRRMAAAYIGNAERLLTDEEAFERAADEVGIYEVVDVDIDVTDVPSGDADGGTEAEAGSGAGTDGNAASESGPASGVADDAEPAGSETVGADVGGDHDPETHDGVPGATSLESPTETDTEAGTGAGATADSSSDADRSTPDDVPQTGITTPDAQSRETEPVSPGITEDPSSIVDEAEGASQSDGSADELPNGPGDSISEGTGAEVGREGQTRSSESRPRPQSEFETESESGSGNPDPEDLEAAAEELAENGVPWADADADVDEGNTTDLEGESPLEPESDSSSPANVDPDAGPDLGSESGPERGPGGDARPSDGTDLAGVAGDVDGDDLDERFKQEERWRETRSIPSLDPDNSSDPSGANARSSSSARQSQSRRNASRADRSQTQSRGREFHRQRRDRDAERGRSSSQGADEQRSAQQRSTPTSSASSTAPEDAETLEADMLEREDKIDQLTQRIDTLEGERETLREEKAKLERERDRLQSTNQELSSTVERLESRIEELESELEELRSAAGGSEPVAGVGTDRSTQLSAEQALTGTNLFVRYQSRSQPTLETAHEGDADAVTVGSNLRLEHHTQFDEADATVEGQPYEEFLTETLEYQFVDWLTGTLLYEIRDTGHANALADLYDVIPRIDRAELHAGISLEEDDTEDVPDLVTFDVVAFDKRGTPLVVANLNDSRDPADRDMLIELEETASAVGANYPDLGAAMVITSSFFDPGALEVTEQATSGGFLSRGSKLSYVSLSRKQGYHLCLVESRSGGFHVNVPEL